MKSEREVAVELKTKVKVIDVMKVAMEVNGIEFAMKSVSQVQSVMDG